MDSPKNLIFSIGARIQQRWVFAVMGSLAIINAYTMRICLSMAITEMVKPTEKRLNQTSDDACPASSEFPISSNSSGGGTYEWDEVTQGIILSSFYWGYILTQIPGGLLSARFGGKHVVGIGILSTGILSLLTPTVVEISGSTGLIVLRLLMGLGEGTTFGAVGSMIAYWAPPHERTKISTMVMSGLPIGTVIGTALSGVLIRYSSIGWPLVFYFFGGGAVLWFLGWVILCYNHPDDHPFISDDEKKYLSDAMSEHTQRRSKPIPWRQMMTSTPVWALLVGHFGFTWGMNMMITDLPKYMSSVLRFSIQANGFLSALPHVLTWVVSNGSSWLADWLIKSERTSRTNVRKALSIIAAVLSAIFLVAASYAGCDRTVVVIFFTIGLGMTGLYYPSLLVNANDLSPNFSGTLMGCLGTVGALTGTLAPYAVGVLTPHHRLSEWRSVFWITALIAFGSSVIFAVWGNAEVQQWNNLEQREKNQKELKERKTSASLEEKYVRSEPQIT